MDALDKTWQDALARNIVGQYGDGVLRYDKYLFEQITRLPPGTSARRIKAGRFASAIAEDKTIVFLDPHTSNRKFAQEVAAHCGDSDALAFSVQSEKILGVLQFSNCDMYLLSPEGTLLAVATHEDSEEDGERMIWIPQANASDA